MLWRDIMPQRADMSSWWCRHRKRIRIRLSHRLALQVHLGKSLFDPAIGIDESAGFPRWFGQLSIFSLGDVAILAKGTGAP